MRENYGIQHNFRFNCFDVCYFVLADKYRYFLSQSMICLTRASVLRMKMFMAKYRVAVIIAVYDYKMGTFSESVA